MTTMDDTDHDQGGTGARKRVIRLPLLPLAPFILLLHPSNLLFSLRGSPLSHDYDSHLQVTPVPDPGFTPILLLIGWDFCSRLHLP